MSEQHAEPVRPRVRNPDRDADPAELARFRRNPRHPDAAVRFARHVLERDPENLLARMMLANHTEDAAERRRILKEACDIGWGLWNDYRQAGGRIAWWEEKDTQPFMMATLAYGTELARADDRDMADLAYRLLLKLDPQDRMGAEAVFTELGVVSAPAGSPGMSM